MTFRIRFFPQSPIGLLAFFYALGPVQAAGAQAPPDVVPPAPAVVITAIENLYQRPDELSPVDDQVILGEAVEVLQTVERFARVRTVQGSAAWILRTALRDGDLGAGPIAEVTSVFANVYREPDVTGSRPLVSAPLGARMLVEGESRPEGHAWFRVKLPDGRKGFVAMSDVAVSDGPVGNGADSPRTPTDPASWIELASRFLGAPYTWGGTTPAGYDCSGLVSRVMKRQGVVLKRNSAQQCFRDPQLVPVAFADLLPGDLLFFGTENKIDHEAIWMGDGRVIQATAYGVPSTQITRMADSPRLRDRFCYARRLATLPTAHRPVLNDAKRDELKGRLQEIAGAKAAGGATYGVVFHDLSSGERIALAADRTMHAASTMKTPILLEVMRRVDAATLRLEDEIPVANRFASIVDGSPFELEIEKETDGPTAEKLGKKAPLGFLIREMIIRSSNLATNIVLSLVGPQPVQELLAELGASTVHVRRCVEDTKAYEKGLNNETDAAGMATVMEAAVRSPKLSPRSRAKIWEILTAQTFNDQIPAGLHPQSGAVVGHKTGDISSVQHDAAVVRLPDGREYVLVLLATDFGANEEGRKSVIETTKKMSRAVWEAMIAP